jgi:hypothetical protein
MSNHVDGVSPSIYQFHVLLLRVSPAIWRRILLPSSATLADLHFVLQLGMGWNDSFGSEFVLYGRSFAVARPGDYRDPTYPERMTLSACQLRLGQRFTYTYNFLDIWQLQIRLEKLLPPVQSLSYPYSLTAWLEPGADHLIGVVVLPSLSPHASAIHHTISLIVQRSSPPVSRHMKLLNVATAANSSSQQQQLDYWRQIDYFDRKALNCSLKRYAESTLPLILTYGDIAPCN